MKKQTLVNKVINRVDGFTPFINEVKKYELLTQEEEQILIPKAQAGDKKAMDTLINANTRFIISVGKQYSTYFHTILDLVNVGVIGLIQAVKDYDLKSNRRLLTFGVWSIRGEMLDYISKTNLINIPYNKTTKTGVVKTAVNRYINIHGITPSIETINEITDDKINLADIKIIVKLLDWDIASINQESNEGLIENIKEGDEQSSLDNKDEATILIKELVRTLPEREKFIIEHHWGIHGKEDMSLQRISDKLNITPEGVRKIEMRVMSKLKQKLINYED